MATGNLPQAADPLGAALGQALFGGATTTTNPGNIAPLQQVLAQLQAQDFNALLQSIFQQAGGQIPGLQAAYGNAMGARSGGNSAVQAALNELLKQTALAGQQQIAQQQAQNFQTQGQAAANIAQATRGTQTTQGADLGGIAKNLLLLQGLSMLTGKSGPLAGLGDKVGEVGKAVGGLFTSPTSTQAVTGSANSAFGPQSSAGLGGLNYQSGSSPAGFMLSQPVFDQSAGLSQVDLGAPFAQDYYNYSFDVPQYDFGNIGNDIYGDIMDLDFSTTAWQ